MRALKINTSYSGLLVSLINCYFGILHFSFSFLEFFYDNAVLLQFRCMWNSFKGDIRSIEVKTLNPVR